MRVTELGVQVQSEVVVERKLFVSQLDVLILTLSDNSTSVDGLNNGINAVLKVFNKHGFTLL